MYIKRIDKKANSNSFYSFKFSFAMIQLEVFCFSFALMAVRKGFQTLLRFNVLSGQRKQKKHVITLKNRRLLSSGAGISQSNY